MLFKVNWLKTNLSQSKALIQMNPNQVFISEQYQVAIIQIEYSV